MTTTTRLTPTPSPDDPACPSCQRPIKHGTPVVLKFGQTLHLRCWTLMLRGQMTAMERNRIVRAGRATVSFGPRPSRRPLGAAWSDDNRTPVTDSRPVPLSRRAGAPPAGLVRRGSRCPVCVGPATLTDWRRTSIGWPSRIARVAASSSGCRCWMRAAWPGWRQRIGRSYASVSDISAPPRVKRGSLPEMAPEWGALNIRTERPDRPPPSPSAWGWASLLHDRVGVGDPAVDPKAHVHCARPDMWKVRLAASMEGFPTHGVSPPESIDRAVCPKFSQIFHKVAHAFAGMGFAAFARRQRSCLAPR